MRLMVRRQRGVTLLESMIAIVLVALGVLGILGVQLRTLADTQTAVRRAQAIRLIEDLGERIKANPTSLTAAVLANYVVGENEVSGAPPNCANGCGPGDTALADIAQWKANVAATMPLGEAAVFVVAQGTATNVRPQLGVMVSWRENERQREGATAAENAAYKAPFATATVTTGAATGVTSVSCPADRICHLQYLQPTLRCAPYVVGDAADPKMYCP
ncbi:type IV pilus modification protein PilV [Pseudorhodoferax sp. LjRoot39]|uniref:type IV pilus modification protein PilV n=1 Tax=Pseudorhodoferax sp. LjRoot39 TaxID=3342328 RepID=UPI003ED13B41